MEPSQLTIRMATNNKIFATDKLCDMLAFIIMTHRAIPLTGGQCVKKFNVFLGNECTVSDLLKQCLEVTYK